MYKYHNLYKSFEEFFSSVLRGNEIEFWYNKKQFYIVPHYDSSEKVIGVCLGEAYTDNENIYLSSNELYNARIEKTSLNLILSDIDISWYNF